MSPRDPDALGYRLPAYGEDAPSNASKSTTTRLLRRSKSAAFGAVVYCSLLLFSWIVMAISTQRPLLLSGYTARDVPEDKLAGDIKKMYEKSQRYYDAAQVIGNLTHLLTIPVISTVVAAALAVRLQRDKNRSYTIRQMVMLADRHWNSPLKMLQALSRPLAYYSFYLWAATLLTLLGVLVALLQFGLLGHEAIRVPSGQSLRKLTYAADLVPTLGSTGSLFRPETVTVDLREKLSSTHKSELQPYLWRRRNDRCNLEELATGFDRSGGTDYCAKQELNLKAVGDLDDPVRGPSDLFMASLPSAFSSGTLSQFALGMQPEVSISRTALPDECNSDANTAFFVEYSSAESAERNWTITACMLLDTLDLVQPIRARQNVREIAYFSFDFPGSRWERDDDPPILEVSVDTTIGYFVLPNFANHDEPGPFVDRDPLRPPLADGLVCQAECSRSSSDTRRRDLDRSQGPGQLSFRDAIGKGPLAYFTEALFGHGSYVHMQNYTDAMPILTTDRGAQDRSFVSSRPLRGLMGYFETMGCTKYVLDSELLPNDSEELMCLAGAFLDDERETMQMLHASMLLAAESFLTSPDVSSSNSIRVYSDPGMDYLRPTMSKGGVLVISVLVGVLVASLLGLSLYAAMLRNWTSSLNALTLMRIGAELGPERLPMLASHSPLDVHELDRLRINVGDKQPSPPLLHEGAGEAEPTVGILSALGGARIDTRKKFLAYQKS